MDYQLNRQTLRIHRGIEAYYLQLPGAPLITLRAMKNNGDFPRVELLSSGFLAPNHEKEDEIGNFFKEIKLIVELEYTSEFEELVHYVRGQVEEASAKGATAEMIDSREFCPQDTTAVLMMIPAVPGASPTPYCLQQL